MDKPFPLPVRTIGPGSQVEEEELQYLAMPRDMATFAMPRVPETAPYEALAAARDLLARFLAAFERWDPASEAPSPRLDLTGVPEATLTVVNDMLGEGEVSIQVGGPTPHRIQESVFAGVWRVCALDGDGRLVADAIEAAPVPAVALAAARAAGAERIAPVEIPPGAMNSPALLAEIGAQLAQRRQGAATHVLNLTLFPLTPDDHRVLERALPVGPVAMISRGFGNCHITSTSARSVWRVQYFNSMQTLILNTIEIVDVPEVALAAVEDLVDSRERLAELIEWMDSSLVEAAR
jgi:hydrogenase-1 operon protein HyaF